jgi:hypothetical protein
MIPVEARFIVDPGGLCDLVSGASDIKLFHKLMRKRWWYRGTAHGQTRGLHEVISQEDLERSLARFRRVARELSVELAARNLINELFDPVAAEFSAKSWIEMTPPNIERGLELLSLIPDMRLIHSLRDGRNVAASVARMRWGPDDPFEALDWWHERMSRAARGSAGVGDRLLIVQLEDLVVRNREAVLSELFDFVGLDITPEVDAFVNKHFKADRTDPGRWRESIPSSRHAEFEARYQMHLEDLRSQGITIPG